VSTGRLDARARVYTDDDIGKVAASVNTMLDRLVETQRSLGEANQRLEVMNRVAMAAGREQELPEVLDAILQGFEPSCKALSISGWIVAGFTCEIRTPVRSTWPTTAICRTRQ